jgi:hypothetical protein
MNNEEINLKAIDLIQKYQYITGSYTTAKQCAIISVGLVINQLNSRDYGMTNTHSEDKKHWKSIKQAIENL